MVRWEIICQSIKYEIRRLAIASLRELWWVPPYIYEVQKYRSLASMKLGPITRTILFEVSDQANLRKSFQSKPTMMAQLDYRLVLFKLPI